MDFVGQLPDGTLHILDFKTGTKEENDPIQLHTYAILAEAFTQKPISKISYWYLDKDTAPKEAVLDALSEKLKWLTDKCLEIEKAISENNWICIKADHPGGLCYDCKAYQAVIEGKGEFLYSDEDFKKDMYLLQPSK